jgi:hypothetical protein
VLKSNLEILQALRIDALDTSNPLRVLKLTNYKGIERLKSPQRNQRLKISSLSCGLTKKAEPPPTRGVNRDSGTTAPTAVGSGDWLGITMCEKSK